jgi:hypothetical protein
MSSSRTLPQHRRCQRMPQQMRGASLALWWRTIRRRRQKHRINWTRILVLAQRWLPRPRALHPFPDARFARHLSEIRTGCANQGPCGGQPARAVPTAINSDPSFVPIGSTVTDIELPEEHQKYRSLYFYCTVIVILVVFTIDPADPEIEIV